MRLGPATRVAGDGVGLEHQCSACDAWLPPDAFTHYHRGDKGHTQRHSRCKRCRAARTNRDRRRLMDLAATTSDPVARAVLTAKGRGERTPE